MLEQIQDKSTQVIEKLNPRNTPALGFQSYEMLGDSEMARKQAKIDFLTGKDYLPRLAYTRIDVAALDAGIGELNDILDLSQDIADPLVSDAVWNSAAYRMAEMYFLKAAKDLNNAVSDNVPEKVVDKLKGQYQTLNEVLYGVLSPEEKTAVLGEAWALINGKTFTDQEAEFKKQLEDGFTYEDSADNTLVVNRLQQSDKRLPVINKELLDTFGQFLKNEYSDIYELISDYEKTVIDKRPTKEERTFNARDFKTIFELVHAMRDPEGSSGVQVEWEDGGRSCSWNTPRMAVVVGSLRPSTKESEDDSKDIDQVFGVVVHEYLNHAGRAIDGAKTDIPVLGSGLFTDAEEGESSDYLTFEEGLGGLAQKAVTGKTESWKVIDIEKTLALSLAYEGRNFREVFEVLWRVRALLTSKESSGVFKVADLDKSKRNAYEACVRIFRGTPIELPRMSENGEPQPITFNKDIANLRGKVSSMNYIEGIIDKPEEIRKLFKGKYDPTNQRQKAIFEQAQSATI